MFVHSFFFSIEVVGFIRHHLGEQIPTKASTWWFLVISASHHLTCNPAVGMPMPIIVAYQPIDRNGLAKVDVICGLFMG